MHLWIREFGLTDAEADSTILELAAGSRGINHGDRPIGTQLSPRLQAEDLFGTWIDDVSFQVDGIGWDLVNSLIGSCYHELGLPSLKSAVVWVFTKYRAEIERGIRIEPRRLRDMYHRALWSGRGDLVDIVASYFGLSQDHPSFDGFGPLERLIWRMIGEVEEVRIPGIVGAVQCLLRNGVNPHLAGREAYFSPHAETALSIAMYTPGAFWHWRNIMRCLSIDPGTYFEEELRHASRLTELGWSKKALLALWDFEYPSSFFNERSTCHDCSTYFYFSWGKWWDNVLRCVSKKQVVEIESDEIPEWTTFAGWTPELRDAYFKGWVQMKSSDAGTAYAGIRAEAAPAHEGRPVILGHTPSHSRKSSVETQGPRVHRPRSRTPSTSSSSESSGVAFRTPSHTESELDDASQRDIVDPDAESKELLRPDGGGSGTGENPGQTRVWWRYRPEEEQRCPECRSLYIAQQMERLETGTQQMPGAFPL